MKIRTDRSGNSGAYLSIQSLCKSYDGHAYAVDHVELAIDKGEFITLLGPSGSGKTTTLSMVAGFEFPTSGDIRVNDRSLVQVPVHHRNIGMVFQNYALFPHMSALENVAFPLRMRKVSMPDARRRARQTLDIVGLGQHTERLPRQLSGGQQQRVALARALVFEPDVLLLDEPLSALDKNLREQMQIEIKRLHVELGMTTLFVTHDQSEAMAMSDRIAVFNKGRIEQFGAPLAVYDRPATHFVASFIGDSNIFDVIVEDSARGVLHCDLLGCVQGAPTGLPAGSAATLMIRPESLRLHRFDDAACGQAVFVVEAVLNYGDRALVTGRVAGREVRAVMIKPDFGAIHVGARLAMSWQPEDGHVLAGSA